MPRGIVPRLISVESCLAPWHHDFLALNAFLDFIVLPVHDIFRIVVSSKVDKYAGHGTIIMAQSSIGLR